MPTEGAKKILAVLQDLFFVVKIRESAKAAGFAVELAHSEADALDKAAGLPALVIVDLNFAGVDALQLIRVLKADPATEAIPVLGYLSHIQGELKRQAREAGCDVVLAKSAFSQKLPEFLKRHPGPSAETGR